MSEDSFQEGRYRIVELLGTGGSAAVYLVHDERLGVRGALKVICISDHDPTDRQRWFDEARIAAQLDHPVGGRVSSGFYR